MQAITKGVGRVRGSTLDEGLKTRISERLDELLASYIVEDRILERVDDPSRPLHVRAFMLLAMCTPAILPEGRAAQLARSTVVKHQRRPHFERSKEARVGKVCARTCRTRGGAET